jgi:hypothetical protein
MTTSDFRALISRFAEPLWNSARDLLPIVVTVAVFQLFVFQQPLENVGQMVSGLVLVIAGLTLFVVGLEVGLFPVGAQLAQDFAKKGSVPWLIAFAFALGFGTTFAEPALIAVAGKAAELAVAETSSGASGSHAAKLRIYAQDHCGYRSRMCAGGGSDANHSGLAAPFFHHGRIQSL